MKRIGFSIEKDENKNTEIPTVPQITDEPVRSVVTVRFPGGREYPYYNDMFNLRVGDVVYVDGKLAGKAGLVIDVTTKFKVSLDYYKRVLARLNLEISGQFTSANGFMISKNPNSVTAEQATEWFIPPREEAEEFFVGEGYTVDLKKIPNCDDIDIENFEEGIELFDDDCVKFINITNGKGTAFVFNNKPHKVEFTIDEDGMITDLLCDCIKPDLCRHCLAVCIALDQIMKEERLRFNITNLTAIEFNTFFRIATFKRKNITVNI